MATSKSTTTRKPSTTRAASSTSTSKGDTDPAATPDPAETEQPAAPAPEQPAEQPAEDDQSDDPATALKKKIRTTQHIENAREDTLTDEQRLNLVGAPASALPGPRTLPSPGSPTRANEEYVHAETEGHIAFVPKRQRQSSTVRVWIAGQHVRKDVYDALSGFVAATPAEARVLSDEEYAQVAPHL